MSLGDLPLLSTSGSFCHRCCLCTTSCLHPFGSGRLRRLFRFAKALLAARICTDSLLCPCCISGLLCSRLCRLGCGLSLGLSQQCLLANLLGSTMTQLRTVLAARS